MTLKKKTWPTYLFWIVLTEALGAVAGLLSREGTALYNAAAVKPALSPPPIVFPIVWSILYLLMAVSAARVDLAPPRRARSRGLALYVAQLGFNFFWSLIFFQLRAYGFAFGWLVVLWLLIAWMALTFRRVDRPAAWLQVPYLLWVAFAGYLNFAVWHLNP
jgi:tryptophan-rich sensory protein